MGGVITFSHKGDFNKTTRFLNRVSGGKYILDKLRDYGKMGVEALANATPVDTGKTSQSWTYDISYDDSSIVIVWNNTNVNNYVNIAVIVDKGHGTRNGGYVSGRHYIEPAIQPVFDKIAEDIWKEVKSS